jgi:hypothetical protein
MRPAPSRSTCWTPYSPRSSSSNVASTLGRDRAGVAQDVRQQRAVAVLAPLLDGHVNAGQLAALLLDDARHVTGHVRRYADVLEALAGVAVDRLDYVRGRHFEQRREPGDHRVALSKGQVARPHAHHVRRYVDGNRSTGTVVDQASRCSDGLLEIAPLLGQAGVVATVDDLQVEKACRQESDNEDDDQSEDTKAHTQPGARRVRLSEDVVGHRLDPLTSRPVRSIRIDSRSR